MVKLPRYEQQVQPDTAVIPSAPSNTGNPGLVLSSMNKNAEAVQGAASALGDVGQKLYAHAQKMQKLENEKQASALDTQFRQGLQDVLYSPGTETIKVNGQDVERPRGIMNRSLSQAKDATVEFDNYYKQQRAQILDQVKDPETNLALSRSLDNQYFGVRDNIIGHESKQLRADLVNTFKSNLSQQIKDAANAQDPLSLTGAINDVKAAQDRINRSADYDQATADLNMQKSIAATVDTAVTNKLLSTGNLNEANDLLFSVKDSIDLDSYNNIMKKTEMGAESIRRVQERAKSIKQNDNALSVLSGLSDGSLNWTNLHKIDELDVPEEFKMAAKSAVKAQIENINAPKEKSSIVNIDDAGTISSKDEAYANHIADVLNGGDKETVINTIKEALNNYGKGTISQEHLNILMNLAIARGNSLPIKADAKNGVPVLPLQVPIDAGAKSIMNWSKQSGISDPQVMNDYLEGVREGKSPKDSHDAAIRSAVIKVYPNMANHESVPNMVIGKDSPVRVIFPQSTTVYPNRIYDAKTKSFKPNPNLEKSNKDKSK